MHPLFYAVYIGFTLCIGLQFRGETITKSNAMTGSKGKGRKRLLFFVVMLHKSKMNKRLKMLAKPFICEKIMHKQNRSLQEFFCVIMKKSGRKPAKKR